MERILGVCPGGRSCPILRKGSVTVSIRGKNFDRDSEMYSLQSSGFPSGIAMKFLTDVQRFLRRLRESEVRVNRPGSHLSESPRLIEAEYFRHVITDFDLWFLSEGKATLRYDGSRFDLFPGCCLWLRPRLDASFEIPAGNVCRIHFIHFDLRDRDGSSWLDSERIGFLPIRQEIVAADYFESAMRQIFRIFHANGGSENRTAWMEPAETIMRALLTLASYELLSDSVSKERGLPRRHRRIAAEMMMKIKENPGFFRSASDVAEVAGYQPDHFTRIFKATFQQTPSRALILARVERARDLLLASELNVGEVAEAVGYDSIQYFSIQFKSVVGSSPSAYRSTARSQNRKTQGIRP